MDPWKGLSWNQRMKMQQQQQKQTNSTIVRGRGEPCMVSACPPTSYLRLFSFSFAEMSQQFLFNVEF